MQSSKQSARLKAEILRAAVQDNADTIEGRLPIGLRPERHLLVTWTRNPWMVLLPVSIIVGLVLVLGWAFTEHRALWANRNALLFDPLCLLLLPGAWSLLRGRDPSSRFRLLLPAIAGIAALALLPLWLQALPQRNGNWIALLLPIHAAFAWAWAKRKA